MTFADAEREAILARKCMQKFDHDADLAREQGCLMPPEFYDAMACARATVTAAEHALARYKELLR